MRGVKCLTMFALLGTVVITPRLAFADTLRTWQSGDWQAGAFAANDTKQFSQCRASKPMDPRTNVVLVYSRSGIWVLALMSSDSFRTAVGASQSVALSIDQTTNWTITAKTQAINILDLPLAAASPVVDALRHGRQLSVQTADGHHGTISLDGTDRMMNELMQCTQSYLAMEEGGTTPSFAAGQPAPAAPGAMSPQAPSVPPPQTIASPALELAATRIASNLLLQAGLPNAHLLSPAETPAALKGLGASWTSAAGAGSVVVLPSNAGPDASQVALAMIVGGANTCKGEFAAGRSTSLVDDTLVTRAFAACSDSSGTRNVHYFVLHRDGSWYIVYAVVPLEKPGANANSPLRDAAFEAVAVKAALYQ